MGIGKLVNDLAPAALLTAMAMGLAGPAVADAPLKMGVILPMTGQAAFFGADQVQAATWAVEEINAAGGVNGRDVAIVPIDSQADPKLGINAAQRLISVDGVPMFVVSWSAVVRATAPVANRNEVLGISSGATAPEIARLGEYFFTIYPLADVEGTAAATWHVEELGYERAAVVFINNESGIDGAKVYRDAFEAAGGDVVAYEAYDPKERDFSSVLLRVQAASPDIVWVQGDVAEIPPLIAQMRQLGLNQRVATTSIGQNNRVLEQLGAAAEGLLVTSLAPGVDVNPRVGDYLAMWEQREGRAPNGLPFTQYIYDSVYLARDLYQWVLDNELEPTGANLRRALVEGGPFDLPQTGLLEILIEDGEHHVRKPVYMLEVVDGAYVPRSTVTAF